MSPQTVRELALKLIDEDCSARRLGKATRQMRLKAVHLFLRWTQQRGSPDLRTLRAKDFVAYQAWLGTQVSKRTGELLSPGTQNVRFEHVCILFSCLYRAGVLVDNPTQHVHYRVPEPKGHKRRPFSLEEITQFLETLDPKNPTGMRDRSLFELMYSSGLRVSEIAALRIGDIDFDRRVMIVRGKFDRDRAVPISSVAYDILLHYVGERVHDREAWVYPGQQGHLRSTSISERFRDLMKRFGMQKKDLTTHSIRHSTATHLLENGANVRHVQELLGHSCLESTVRYTHVMTDSLYKVYRKYHPSEHELFETLDEDYHKRLARLQNEG